MLMSLFSLFKRKPQPPAESILNYRQFYLYGFTDNPYRQSDDAKSFDLLYEKVIGGVGGIIIGSSFHPYQIVNQKGTTVWQASYVQIYLNENSQAAFETIKNENARFFANPASSFQEFMIWPDSRLNIDQEPMFERFIPFIIPFLVYMPKTYLKWDIEIKTSKSQEHSTSYVEDVNNAIRFLMPEPSLVLGFDEFDEKNPSALVDNFLRSKSMLLNS